jgi:hypothetical protein
MLVRWDLALQKRANLWYMKNARGTCTFTKRGLQIDMTCYTKTKMPLPSPVQNISPALSPLTDRSHSLPSHRPAGYLIGFGRNPSSAISEIRPHLLSGYPRSLDLAGGQRSDRESIILPEPRSGRQSILKPRSSRKLTHVAAIPLLRPRQSDLLVGLPLGWSGSWLASVSNFRRCLDSTRMRN